MFGPEIYALTYTRSETQHDLFVRAATKEEAFSKANLQCMKVPFCGQRSRFLGVWSHCAS